MMMLSSSLFRVFAYLVVFGCTICSSRTVTCPSMEDLGCADLSCPFGDKSDTNGCPTCDCADAPIEPVATVVPPPVESTLCRKFSELGCGERRCIEGNKLDAAGCETCECSSGPVRVTVGPFRVTSEPVSAGESNKVNQTCPDHDCDRLNCPFGLEADERGCVLTCKCKLPPRDRACSNVEADCNGLSCPYEVLLDDDQCIVGCRCKALTFFGQCPEVDCSRLDCPNGLDDSVDENGCTTSCRCKNRK